MTDTPPADASNWRTPPHSRWAFHHVAEILPTAEIAASPDAKPLPEAAVSLDGFKLDLPGGATLDLHRALTATATDAFVVLKDGAVAFEHYANGMNRETPHILMSMSKAFTGTLAAVLERDGVLDPSARIADILPELAQSGYAKATLRHLLDMRTGVRVWNADPVAYAAILSGDEDRKSFIEMAKESVASDTDGGSFGYTSLNTDLIGQAIERLTGQSFAEVASERLWRPIGAEHTAQIVLDRVGAPWSSGGVCATARDMARLGQAVLDGARGVPPALLADLTRAGDREAWAKGEWGSAFSGVSRSMSYRSGWYTQDDRRPQLFAMGVHGQNLFLDPESGVVIAKVSSQPERIDGQLIGLQHLIAAEVVRLLASG